MSVSSNFNNNTYNQQLLQTIPSICSLSVSGRGRGNERLVLYSDCCLFLLLLCAVMLVDGYCDCSLRVLGIVLYKLSRVFPSVILKGK